MTRHENKFSQKQLTETHADPDAITGRMTEMSERRATRVAPLSSGGEWDSWRKYFVAATLKTLKRRQTEVKSRQRYATLPRRFATSFAVFACFLFLVATVSAKTITVTGTGDTIAVDGKVTLREAITAANTNAASGDAPAGDPGVDTIKFNIAGGTFHTIVLSAALPAMTGDPIIIDGTSQPGYAGAPVIELNGNNLSATGLFIQAGNSTIKGLVINRFNGRGIILTNNGGNTIVNNYIGTNGAGTADLGNTQEGILIQSSSSSNLIGGSSATRNVISGNGASGVAIYPSAGNNNIIRANFIGTNAAGTAAIGNGSNGVAVSSDGNIIGGLAGLGNVISGNSSGVVLDSTADGNFVWGNFIGTNLDGTAALGNAQSGLSVSGKNNQIGGNLADARNVISGNGGNGVLIWPNTATGNSVQGNKIGTNAAGTASLGNAGTGIRILDSSSNTIGGTAAGAGNVISGNTGNGISIETSNGIQVQGNRIGTNATGTASLGNGSYGIRIINSSNNTIGGTTAGARNLISGNGRGLSIENAQSANNLVRGNYIGVDVNGTATLANNGSGVEVSAHNNDIGGDVAGAGNVISGNAGDGIVLTQGGDSNMIQGNMIGTNAAGTAALGNIGAGVRFIDATNNLVGGTTAAMRNIISGNIRGVTMNGSGGQNLIKGNYIGTDSTGSVALGNKFEGVWVMNAGNTIGGTAGHGNLISGNLDGVRISGSDASNNIVQGNLIGTKLDGVSPLPNTSVGVAVSLSSKNTIGGTAPGVGNTIAENGYAGVFIGSGIENSVLGNSIFNNARLGIELDGHDALGLIENDPGDTDVGANWRQNYPLLTSVTTSGADTLVNGTLNSEPNKQFRIEFFFNMACNASGFGEGKTFFGSTTVTTDANGNAVISATFPVVPNGQFVTATATSFANDTSEFSPCALIGGPNPGKLQFASSFFLVAEALGTAYVTVTRSNGMAGAVTVNYTTSDLTATNSDYTTTSGTLTFADGEVIKTFTIPINPDADPESQETVGLTLSAPTGGATLGANTTSTLYINDADPTFPGVTFSDASLFEGHSGTTNMVFTISLTPHSIPIEVAFTTVNGNATAPDDYQVTSGVLVFSPGENSKQVVVPIHGDMQKEGDEILYLNLTELSKGYYLKGVGTGLIIDDEISKFQFDSATYTVNENGGQATITVTRTGDTSTAVSVNYATSDVTAKAGEDYATASGTLNFASGEASKTFAVSITDDPAYEGDQTVSLTLSGPSAGAQLGNPATAILTIVDDEQPPVPVSGTIDFAAAEFAVNENGGQATITVTRKGGSNGAVSVDYFLSNGGTATPKEDFTSVTGTLSWNDGDTTDKTFPVAIIDDSLDELGETVELKLNNPMGGAVIGNLSSTTLTITDNDATPSISISDVTQSEGKSGTTNFTFDVTLSAASGQTVTVDYLAADGTAVAGTDYQAAGGSLTFAPGETSKTIVVAVNGDTDDEPDEAYVVNLSNPANATVGKAQGTGMIVNDDSNSSPTIQFSQATYQVQEQLGAVTVTVTRSGDSSAAASVDYQTIDGGGTQRSDFEYAAGTLAFAPGEVSKVLQLLVNEDSFVEGAETFTVKLNNPAGAVLGQQGSTNVEITDDVSESTSNPIDDAESFVYMHYHDFLNREPDPAGLAFWTNQITSCGSDEKCIEERRINVSASFFLSIEFQETSYLRFLLEKESFSSTPKYAEFMRDVQELSRGVVVNSPGWEQKLKDNQQQFAEKWVNRPAFKAAYDGMSNTDFVNALYANAGILPTQAERESLVNALEGGNQSRSAIVLEVAANTAFRQKEHSAAFVLMQYFGYLRRDPNTAPDADMSGYNFWLMKLEQFGGNYVEAEMIKAFITSFEYRGRFAQ